MWTTRHAKTRASAVSGCVWCIAAVEPPDDHHMRWIDHHSRAILTRVASQHGVTDTLCHAAIYFGSLKKEHTSLMKAEQNVQYARSQYHTGE